MEWNKINWNRAAAVFICLVGGCVGIYLLFKYALAPAMPFLLAWLTAIAIRPVAAYISRRTKIPLRITSVILMLLVLCLIGILIFVISSRILYELRSLISRLGSDMELVEDYIQRITDFFNGLADKVPLLRGLSESEQLEEIWNRVNEIASGMIEDFIMRISAVLPAIITFILRSLPDVLLFVVISIIAAFYFALDLQTVNKAVLDALPPKWAQGVQRARQNVSGTILKYLRAYLFLMVITFIQLLIGFLILEIDYAFILALVIAVIDILPVLGVGTILVPWGVVLMIGGNYYIGFGLLIIFAIITVVRQFAEPKIVGESLGLHPIITLVAIYAGFKLFGIFGMIVGPVVAMIAKSALTEGRRAKEEKRIRG
ncbi:MAG: sporulation integral membrane protein YtvI [Clostridiales bacterium]|nr:sporulation integral membrane protein YtvI [Clostridiales bacterium]